MHSFAQAKPAARQLSDGPEQRNDVRETKALEAPAGSNAEGVSDRSPATHALLHMRHALDQSADVQSQLALRRALNHTPPARTAESPAPEMSEAAPHVVQQKQGRVKPTLQAKGGPIDVGLQQEADILGRRMIHQRQVTLQRVHNPGAEDEKIDAHNVVRPAQGHPRHPETVPTLPNSPSPDSHGTAHAEDEVKIDAHGVARPPQGHPVDPESGPTLTNSRSSENQGRSFDINEPYFGPIGRKVQENYPSLTHLSTGMQEERFEWDSKNPGADPRDRIHELQSNDAQVQLDEGTRGNLTSTEATFAPMLSIEPFVKSLLHPDQRPQTLDQAKNAAKAAAAGFTGQMLNAEAPGNQFSDNSDRVLVPPPGTKGIIHSVIDYFFGSKRASDDDASHSTTEPSSSELSREATTEQDTVSSSPDLSREMSRGDGAESLSRAVSRNTTEEEGDSRKEEEGDSSKEEEQEKDERVQDLLSSLDPF